MCKLSCSIMLGLCALLSPLAASAAPLHWPLPADSLEQNGAPQAMKSHTLPGMPTTPAPSGAVEPDDSPAIAGRPYSGTPIDALNYHYDTYPTGWNKSETDLTTASVTSASFKKLRTLKVDGNVFAQPLMVSNFAMPDGTTHNILIVATGHNTVYAYDAQTYAILWQTTLGKPQSSGDVGCGDVEPEYGISSTPVIVRNGAAATIYLVTATEPASMSFHTNLHALNLATGKDIQAARELNPLVNLEGGGVLHFDPQNQWNRTSLVYSKGSIYVGVGAHCDNNAGNVSGWLLRYDAATLTLKTKFATIKAAAGYELASIWMSGFAPAIDDAGDVLAVTGNGNFNPNAGSEGWGESILQLSSTLGVLKGSFTPSNWQDLNNNDTDFGSGGVVAIPLVAGQSAPPLAIAAGKDGTAYLVNAANPGGNTVHGSTPLATLNVGTCFCAPAYYTTSAGGVLFYQGSGDVMRAYSVVTSATPTLTPLATGTANGGFGGSFPMISSNGQQAGTAIVWALERGSTMQLQAYDAAALGAPLFQANAGAWSNGSRGWLSPLVANGRVYAPAAKSVTVFGLAK